MFHSGGNIISVENAWVTLIEGRQVSSQNGPEFPHLYNWDQFNLTNVFHVPGTVPGLGYKNERDMAAIFKEMVAGCATQNIFNM